MKIILFLVMLTFTVSTFAKEITYPHFKRECALYVESGLDSPPPYKVFFQKPVSIDTSKVGGNSVEETLGDYKFSIRTKFVILDGTTDGKRMGMMDFTIKKINSVVPMAESSQPALADYPESMTQSISLMESQTSALITCEGTTRLEQVLLTACS